MSFSDRIKYNRPEKLIPIILILLLVTVTTYCISESDGAQSGNLKISEVNPYGTSEGFSLTNYGTEKVNLIDYVVSDGEGYISFTLSKYVDSGERITFVKEISEGDWFSSRDNVHPYAERGIEADGFLLKDTGDDMTLGYNGKIVDSVCYGESPIPSGWTGESVEKISKNYFLRISSSDTDSKGDWIATKPGYSNLQYDENTKFSAEVFPFTFPECDGEPIFKALENANEEVLISIYQLTNKNLVSLLIDLEKRIGTSHVDVRIILEGDVLNYDMGTELSLMGSIVDAGGEVYVINTKEAGNYERYSYFHNKYAIIDEKSVIITSENWTVNNLSDSDYANRGWGALIESSDYANYMKNVWINDRNDTLGDVYGLKEYFPELKSYQGDLNYESPDYTYTLNGYASSVTPVLSPDNSYTALKSLMDNAETRIYSEQLSLSNEYWKEDSGPISWMNSAASRGVDSRFILDSSMTDTSEIVNYINTTKSVRACTIDGGKGFNTTHNKGILVDNDVTWVGSVNWTETSLKNNRETAVIIYSESVNSFFSEYFDTDWRNNNNTELTDLKITVSESMSGSDRIYLVSVNGPDTVEYIWNADGKEYTTSIPRLVLKNLEPKVYGISVTVKNTSYSAEYQLTVEVSTTPAENTYPDIDKTTLGYFAAGAVAIIGALIALLRRRGH